MNNRTSKWILAGLILTAGAGLGAAIHARAQNNEHLGYQDTPLVPGMKWHVHDGLRPQPKVIEPGTASTNEAPGRPPSDATILFDGKDLSHWLNGNGAAAKWKIEGDNLVIAPGSGSIRTTDQIGDCQLHIEWMEPTTIRGSGQGRGNSGVIFFNKYEIQVLDSYNSKTYPDGQAGSIYGSYPPLVNATRKQGEWQVYDILFTVPRFENEKLTKPGYFTILHNGVVLHNHAELLGESIHRQAAKYSPHPEKGSLFLQDHGNPIRYRNIWFRELKNYDQP